MSTIEGFQQNPMRECDPKYYVTVVFPTELVYNMVFNNSGQIIDDTEVKGMERLSFLKDMDEAKSVSGVVVYRSDLKVHNKRNVFPFTFTRKTVIDKVLEDVELSYWKE